MKPQKAGDVISIASMRGPQRAGMMRYTAPRQTRADVPGAFCVEPCSRCEAPTSISRDEWDRLCVLNRGLIARGEAALGFGQRAMCARCIPEHRAERDAELVREDDADRLLWRRYLAGGVELAELLERANNRPLLERKANEHRTAPKQAPKRRRRRALEDAGFYRKG